MTEALFLLTLQLIASRVSLLIAQLYSSLSFLEACQIPLFFDTIRFLFFLFFFALFLRLKHASKYPAGSGFDLESGTLDSHLVVEDLAASSALEVLLVLQSVD